MSAVFSRSLQTEGAGRAVLLHTASSGLSTVVRLVSSVLLARWVGPADYGNWAVAMAVFGLLHWLRDLGLTTVLQREAVLDQARLSSCLGVLTASGAVAAGVMLLAAPVLEHALARPGLAALLWVLAPALVVAGLGSVLAAVQTRQLAARPLAWVSRVGDVVQPALALGLCSQGWGALGLAVAELGCGLACTAMAWLLRPRQWAWVPRFQGAQDVVRAGLPAQAGALLQHAQTVWPQWCLGLAATAPAQGLFSRAQTLTQWLPGLVTPAVGFAALPVLAARHHRGERLGPTAWQAVGVLALLGGAALSLLVATGPLWLVPLLGPAWAPCLPLLAPLALAALAQLVLMPVPAVLTALGHAAEASRWQAQSLVLRVAFGLAAVVGGGAGEVPLGFAWAMAVAAWLAVGLQLWGMWLALDAAEPQPARRFITSKK